MKPIKITLTLLMTAIIILSGCHFPGRPWALAEITSHADGQSVVLNEEARIIAQAKSSQGIDKVHLFINGELEHIDEPPLGHPLEYTADQPWVPDAEGQAIVSVIAIDRSGVLSDPFSIILQVVPSIEDIDTNLTPTPTVSPQELAQTQTAQASCTNSASFVEHVTIPDNAYITANSNFTKIWRVKNDGTCDWSGYQVVHSAGELMAANSPKALPMVKAGANADIVVDMVAPASAGAYTTVWRIQDGNGIIFGSELMITINVKELPTDTPTPTATFTSTPTRTRKPSPTHTRKPSPTLTRTPLPTPTHTPSPTNTSTMTRTATPTQTSSPTALPISVEQVSQQITIAPNATGNTTVTCPSGSVVVSGGFAHPFGLRIWHSMQDGNGWRIYANNESGESRTLTVYAVCLFNSGGSSDSVHTQENIDANDTTQLGAACPAGSIVTGGGWVIGSNEDVNIHNSSKSENGWQIFVENTSSETPLVNVYAVCLSGVSGITSQVSNTDEVVAPTGTTNIQKLCPTGKYVTGGGFAMNSGLILYNTSKNQNGWINYVSNTTGTEKLLYTYAICFEP